MQSDSTCGHSADVQLELHAAGHVLPIAKLGPLRCYLREPAELQPGPAEIVIQIDSHRQRMNVWLPCGATADTCSIQIATP